MRKQSVVFESIKDAQYVIENDYLYPNEVVLQALDYYGKNC